MVHTKEWKHKWNERDEEVTKLAAALCNLEREGMK